MSLWDKVVNNNILKNAEGADIKSVRDAEKMLGVQFSDEYIDFLLHVGACIYQNHYIIGISQFPDMKVVEVTMEARGLNRVPQGWYVIEDAGIDGIMVWQDKTGAVFQTKPGADPVRIAESLKDYVGLVEENSEE